METSETNEVILNRNSWHYRMWYRGKILLGYSHDSDCMEYKVTTCEYKRNILVFLFLIPLLHLLRGVKKVFGYKMLEKRQKYFTDKRTTSHWAYPVKVNGQQPQNYGDAKLKINYSE